MKDISSIWTVCCFFVPSLPAAWTVSPVRPPLPSHCPWAGQKEGSATQLMCPFAACKCQASATLLGACLRVSTRSRQRSLPFRCPASLVPSKKSTWTHQPWSAGVVNCSVHSLQEALSWRNSWTGRLRCRHTPFQSLVWWHQGGDWWCRLRTALRVAQRGERVRSSTLTSTSVLGLWARRPSHNYWV